MLVYIHGFNSSPASFKANALRIRMQQFGCAAQFACPALPHQPRAAMQVLRAQLAAHDPAEVTLVGSSLGGYYATYLVEQLGVKAVLVNPALTPARDLRAYLGRQRNLYTHEVYELTPQHLDELAELAVITIKRPQNYLLAVSTGDELLPYQLSLQRYQGVQAIVHEGSDHGFAEFTQYIDDTLRFAGIKI